MNEYTILINQVKDLLIKDGVEVDKVIIYNHFLARCNELSLNEEQFYKQILSKAVKTIDIASIEKAQMHQIEEDRKIDAAIKEREGEFANAPEFIERLVKIAFDDGILEKNELKKIIAKARNLSQDINQLCHNINKKLNDGNYKSFPSTDLEGNSLESTLTSTNWYDEIQYEKVNPPPQKPKTHFPWGILITAFFLVVLVGGAFTYFVWYQPYLIDKNSEKVYNIADNLFLRRSATSAGDGNIIDKLPYGFELNVVERGAEWIEVKAKDTKGYIASDFVLNKSNFIQLNSIFFDNQSREAVESSVSRKALLEYFQNRNYLGKMEPSVQLEIFGAKQSKEIWQLKAKEKSSKTNTVFSKKLNNKDAKYPEFACIISNLSSYQRKFLLFTFDDSGNSTLIYEIVAPAEGYIKDVKRKNRGGRNTYEVVYSDY